MEQPAQHPAHPAQAPKVRTCGPENVGDFNAALRQHAPEAFDLAKALHGLGMLQGLRGARLAIGGTLPGRGGLTLAEICSEKWNSAPRSGK